MKDVQLRMMFSCIHPRLPEEAQVALVLHLLCGFSVGETAAAFLKEPAAMQKRIGRAKKTLARSKRLVELAGAAETAARLPGVLRALYLLFSEGYHGASPKSAVRPELCLAVVQNLFECRKRLAGDGHERGPDAEHQLGELFERLCRLDANVALAVQT